MGTVCPNLSHPDYKALVESYGEDIAIQMFVDNEYQIPTVENNKRPIERVMNKISFPFRSTFDLISEYPKVAEKIIDKLNKDYADVKIVKDRILKEDGTYTEIKPGEQGMHYRNAFQSVVAWANDAYLETPPHEYAHHYIEMFYDTPLVQEAIKKYGGIEPVAEMMGRYYAKKAMSNYFTNFVKSFWQKVKRLFGNVDIGYDLSEAFYNADKLSGEKSAGLSTVNYQKADRSKKLKRESGGYDFNTHDFAKSKKVVPLDKEDREVRYDAEARSFVLETGINAASYSSDLSKDFARKITKKIKEFKELHTIPFAGRNIYKSSLINTTLLNSLDDWLYEEDNMDKLAKAVINNEKLPTDTAINTDIKYVDLLARMSVANKHKALSDESIQNNDGEFYSKKDAVNKTRKEISYSQQKRNQMYDKYIKYKPLKKIVKNVEEFLLYQLNGRLISKYLAGSSDSFVFDSFYKSLNNAENERNYFMIEFANKLAENSYSDKYKNWSYFKNKDLSSFENINSLDTETFSLRNQNGDPVNVKLTKAEMLSFYLMKRQDRTKNALEENGIVLNDSIEGRDIPVNYVFKIDEEVSNDIYNRIKEDSVMQNVVKSIDSAMSFMEENISKTYFYENGIPFGVQDFYFPVYSGKKSFEARKSKSSINDFRSLNLALEPTSPIRLVDPIQVANTYKVGAATYSALAIPLANNRKIIKEIEDQFQGTKEEPYIEAIKTIMNQLEDRTHLYSGQGEQKWEKVINNLTSNFTIAVLGMNVPVMMKQSVSYLTAMESISSKYLKKAGFGSKAYPVINPLVIIKALDVSSPSKGKTILPIEWNLDTDSGTFALMKKWSPALAARLDGMVSRELSEALMNQDKNEDLITIRGFKKKDGSNYVVSKTRLMEGIRVVDAVTIENIWRAAEFEAIEEAGHTRGTDAFYEHVAIRVEQIISETQPNNNITDRSTASNMPNPLARFITMFSSATSKIAQVQIDGVLNFLANPTEANLKDMLRRSANVMITTSMTITIMDAIKTALLYGYEDDEEMFKDIILSNTVNSLSYYYGLGQIIRTTASQLDDKPFYSNLQHPMEAMGQDLAMVLANAFKGNLLKATTKGLELTLKGKGFSVTPLTQIKAVVNRNLED